MTNEKDKDDERRREKGEGRKEMKGGRRSLLKKGWQISNWKK